MQKKNNTSTILTITISALSFIVSTIIAIVIINMESSDRTSNEEKEEQIWKDKMEVQVAKNSTSIYYINEGYKHFAERFNSINRGGDDSKSARDTSSI